MKTALIIDDDIEYRRLIGEILEMHGWRVLEAGAGDAGLELVRQKRPEVILCDLMMPRGNGFTVCRAIRADASLRGTKIIVTSGRGYESDRIAAREAGADEYVTKPFKPMDLVTLLALVTGATAESVSRPAESVRNLQAPARVRFWGVRGSIPSPGPGTVHYGGNTSCIEFRFGGEIIILDAGTGLRPLGRELMTEFKKQPLNLTLLLTHTHWDHIQGLPFFLPIYQTQCHMRILGFEGARRGLESILSSQMESPYFPVPFGELHGNISIEEVRDLHFQVGSVRVEAWFANHPGICVGYRLFAGDASVAFFPDNEPHSRYHRESSTHPVDGTAALEFARGEEQKMVEFLRGADVLILDSQYDREEYKDHVGWGHGCIDDAVALALRADVKQLFLFHHDPDHDDDRIAAMVDYARKLVAERGASLIVDAAREGAIVELKKRA